MKARFDDPLKISADGRKLEACGQLIWDDPDSHKVEVTVTITQGGAVAQDTSGAFDRGAPEWMVNLRPGSGQKFQAGQAQAKGTLAVTVVDPSGNAKAGPPFSWDGQPDLEFDPSVS
jgi:hypothetical protein